MSVNTSDLLFSREAVTQLSRKNQEPQWMLDFRLKALEKATDLRLPKVEKTQIRFWNFTKFEPFTVEPVVDAVAELPEAVQSFVESSDKERNLLVQHNSTVVYSELQRELEEKGVIFTDLHTALREHSDLVKNYFMQSVKVDDHRLTALHGALWSGGAFLYVPKNLEIDVPIQSLLWTDKSSVGLLPHLLIVVGENSKLTYVDNYVSAEDVERNVHNGVAEIYLAAGAKVQYATLHHYGEGVVDTTYRCAVLERDARIDWVLGELNNGDTISDNVSVLKGTGSEAYVNSIAIGSGKQQSNITTNIQHVGTNTSSDILARAAMKDAASGILNSITKIEKGASKANGQQTGRVLMLNEQARGDANPILLIDENDVIAGHAASVGQIDPIQVYYLMSRGISRKDAERLIIYGFLAPMLEEVPIEDVVDQLKRVIERKLS